MARAASPISPAKKAGYIFVGLLILTTIVLSFVQLWVAMTTQDFPAYGNILPNAEGLPERERRGAFVVLSEQRDPRFPSNLVELLAVNQPGVINESSGLHLSPTDIDAILVQSIVLNESGSYRVYRIGEEQEELEYERHPNGRVLIIRQRDATWEPGAYMVDIPADGMFGGRTYFQFYID